VASVSEESYALSMLDSHVSVLPCYMIPLQELPLSQVSINLAKLHHHCLLDIVPMIRLLAAFFSIAYVPMFLGLHRNILVVAVLFPFSGDFIYKVSSLSPTRHFIIHSRKALLNGISPAENRSIPPLKYVLKYFTLVVGLITIQLRVANESVFLLCF
jgi:hypothetical protein